MHYFTPLVAALAEGRTVRCHECALKLEPAGSFKTLVKAYQTTRRHSKEHSKFNFQRHEHPRSQINVKLTEGCCLLGCYPVQPGGCLPEFKKRLTSRRRQALFNRVAGGSMLLCYVASSRLRRNNPQES
jgi:hypothetical protein